MKKMVLGLGFIALLLAAGALWFWVADKYQVSKEMLLPVVEYSSAQYPEDPAAHSAHHNRYKGRGLRLIQKGPARFDFIFESTNPAVARLTFSNVDLTLMTPRVPEWAKKEKGLTLIALTDREWNRQQVAFRAGFPSLEISGGDGFEQKNLFSAELANNCLNAGLWEVLLFTQENGQKTLYYQGWFTFPLGHYATVFEVNNQMPYVQYWHRLEHWIDPAGTVVPLEMMRTITTPIPATFSFLQNERVFVAGEQARKMRTLNAPNVLAWGDFYDGRTVEFATFRKPGKYDVAIPWKNEYWRIGSFVEGKLHSVCMAGQTNHEIELTYSDLRSGKQNRLIIGGLNLTKLPKLDTTDYAKGLYLPMGIGVPPFYQSHEDLVKNPPHLSTYYNVLLDDKNCWIDHHKLALDGMALHRDKTDANRVHLYLLSYERNTVIGHYIISTTSALSAADL